MAATNKATNNRIDRVPAAGRVWRRFSSPGYDPLAPSSLLCDNRYRKWKTPVLESSVALPRVNPILAWLSRLFLKMTGWKFEGSIPAIPKYVGILAPHTSNWDFPYILALASAHGIKFSWFGKKEIFRWPVGGFFKAVGGIPIDRSSQENVVQQTARMIRARDQIVLGITPEGTRSKIRYWKTGFYYIARQAQTPIVLMYLDYARKVGGIGPIIETTGDIDADMMQIQEFYRGITARHPHKVGEVAIRPS